MLFSEKLQTVSFNPPLNAAEYCSKDQSRITDPELHEDIQDVVMSRSEYSNKAFNTDAEQQALFAAVLGMESTNSSDAGEVKNCTVNTVADKYFNKTTLEFVGKDIDEKKWNTWETHYRRCQLFQQLSEYFPQHMVQPKKNLTDFIVI